MTGRPRSCAGLRSLYDVSITFAEGGTMATARRPRSFWTRLVDQFEHSDLTQARFADLHSVSLSSFQYWLYRIRREDHEPLPQAEGARFVEVTAASRHHVPLRITLGSGALAEFAELPSPAYLAALATALEGGTC